MTKYNRLVKFCQYQNLTNYFLLETQIEYNGDVYRISFANAKLLIERTDNSKYRVPKIMYVPAERNFLSAVRWPEKLQGLPESLYTFWEKLDRSQQELSASLTLPVGEVKLEFDKLNRLAKIVGSDYQLNLSEASISDRTRFKIAVLVVYFEFVALHSATRYVFAIPPIFP